MNKNEGTPKQFNANMQLKSQSNNCIYASHSHALMMLSTELYYSKNGLTTIKKSFPIILRAIIMQSAENTICNFGSSLRDFNAVTMSGNVGTSVWKRIPIRGPCEMVGHKSAGVEIGFSESPRGGVVPQSGRPLLEWYSAAYVTASSADEIFSAPEDRQL